MINFLIQTINKSPKIKEEIMWGESQEGPYQDLPNGRPNKWVASSATAIGVDAFQHAPFITKINGELVVSITHNYEHEEYYGQHVMQTRSVDGINWTENIKVIPDFSDEQSTALRLVTLQRMIEVEGVWYNVGAIMDRATPTSPTEEFVPIGIICSEYIPGSAGVPFWVHTPDGQVPQGLSGFPTYSFADVSSKIYEKMQSDDYQLFFYTDANAGLGVHLDALGTQEKMFEFSADKLGNSFVRFSRNHSVTLSAERRENVYVDYGDGSPILTNIPSSPMRTEIRFLNDGRACCTGTYNSDISYREELWIAIADYGTLNFRKENIYRMMYGDQDGQRFPGNFKFGVWAYPDFFHDSKDNKIKIVCSRYKEDIYYYEIDYSTIKPTT